MSTPDFAKGTSGPAEVYDVSPAGLGLSPSYLAPGAVASASGFSGTLPSGSILAYGGSVAPAGYVLCDGSTYDGTQSTYSNLWAAIGVTYGGSGQSAFKVPDLQGRVPVGKGSNASVNALGTNEGVSLANRRPHHRHTPHSHSGGAASPAAGQAGGGPSSEVNAQATTGTADGGSGVSTDSLDAPAFLVINYIIAL